MRVLSVFFFFLIWLFFSPGLVYSQDKHTEVGIGAGVNYYLGDINYTTQFYKPRQSLSVFYRRGIYDHFAARAFINYGFLTASDMDFDFEYQKIRNRSFSKHFVAVGTLAEFNFLPYKPGNVRKEKITPFIAAGISYSFLIQAFTFPFGVGVKYNLTRRWALGAQHFYNFLLQDKIDIGTEQNINGQQISNPKNRDWYACFQISLSYKIDNCQKCPAYD